MRRDNISVDWSGADEMMKRLTQLENRIQWAIKQVALFWGPKLEAYAKENRPWQDRTNAARSSLHYFIEELSAYQVKLYLAHGVQHGLYLETSYAGKFSIIFPTIQRHLPEIRKMLEEVFGDRP